MELNKFSLQNKNAKVGFNKMYYALEVPVMYLPLKLRNEFKSKGKRNITHGYIALGDKTCIGRIGSDFDLDNDTMNPIHFTLWVQEGVVLIKDNGSRLGISVNNLKPIPGLKIILEENDKISVGEMNIRLVKRNTKDNHWDDCTFWPVQSKKVHSTNDVEQILPPPFSVEENRVEMIETPELPEIQEILGMSQGHEIPQLSEISENPKITKMPKSFEKVKKKIIKKENPHFIPSANPIMRFCALCIDIGISALIGMNLMGLKFMMKVEGLLSLKVIPFLRNVSSGYMPDYIWNGSQSFLLMMIVGYVLFGLHRMLFASILGVSLGEFCIGLSGNNGLFWNRVGGVIRNFLGIFTLPLFFILDFPCIIGKRTFKEWVTSSKIVWNGLTQMLVGLFVVMPLIIFANFLWPILIPQYKTPGINITHRKFEVQEQSPIGNVSVDKHIMNSHYFHFQYKDEATNLDLFPSMEVVHSKSQTLLKPKLDFYLKNEKISLTKLGAKNSKLYAWIDKLIDRSIFFTSYYPNLHYFIKFSRFSNGQNSAQENINKKLFPEVEQELIKLITQTLSLDVNNVFPFMLNNGPFLPGYLSFKNKLLSFFPESKINPIVAQIVQLSDRKFLMLYLQRSESFLASMNDEKEYILIPLYGNDPSLYKLSMDSSLEVGKFLSEFSKNVLWSDTSLMQPYQVLSAGLSTRSPLYLLDGLTNKKIKGKERLSLEDALYDYFYSLCQFEVFSSIRQENPSEWKAKLTKIQDYVNKWTLGYSKLSSNYQTTLFIKRLEELSLGIELAREKEIFTYFEEVENS